MQYQMWENFALIFMVWDESTKNVKIEVRE